MTGREIIEWIKEHHAENEEIYIETMPKLFTQSREFEILGSDDCPCMEIIVIK